MSFRGDRRAVTVQIGAVLLLAILFATLAAYQVNVVPHQNQAIEFDHNERVKGDLIELRDAIRNAGTEDRTHGVPVALGTRYDTRMVAINPPHPTGTIRTEVAEENVTVEGSDVTDLDLETRYVVYEPDYNEYSTPPITAVEHTMLYDEYGHANVTLEDQTLVGDGTFVLPIVDGDLSRTDAGTTSITAATLEGPKTETFDDDVVVTLPTRAPHLWNESLAGREGVRVDTDTDRVEIVLDGDVFDEITVARVGVGDDAGPKRLEAFGDEPSDPAVDVDRTFDLEWIDGDEVTVTEGDRETFDVRVTDADTDEAIEEAAVDFSVASGDAVEVRQGQSDESTDDAGHATVELEANEPGDATVYAAAGDDVARLSVTVLDEDPFFAVTIDDFDDTVTEGQDVDFEVTVENTGGEADTQNVDLEIDGHGVVDTHEDLTLDPDESETITLTWETVKGDAEDDVDATVSSDDDAETVQVTVEEDLEEAFFDVEILETNSPVDEGEILEVDVEIENTGDETDEQTIELEVDGEVRDTATVSLVGGETAVETLEWETEAGDAGEYTAEVSSDDDDDDAEVTVLEETDGPFFEVTIDDYDGAVTEGDEADFTVTVENTGDEADTQDVDLEIDGHGVVDTHEDLTLDPDESETITLTWETEEGDAEDDVDATVSSENDSDTVQVTVLEPPFFAVEIDDTNSPVDEGETLTVDAEIENTGDEAGEQTIELEIDGEVRDTVTVELEGGQTTTETLEWTTEEGDAGEYTAEVGSDDDSDTDTVEITAAEGEPPSIDAFETEPRPGGPTGIDVDWDVSSGDAALDEVVIEVLDDDGTLVEGETIDVEGEQQADDRTRFDDELEDGVEYEVVLTVVDLDGLSTSDSRMQVAG